MNKSEPYSLARKLTFASAAISGGTVFVIMATVYLLVVSFGDTFLQNELNENSEFIQKSFTEPIWTFDHHQIDEIGKSLLDNDNYTYVSALKIETVSGEVLFERIQNQYKDKNYSFQKMSKMPHTRWREIKIYKNDQHIANISVAMSNDGYVKAFRNQFGIVLLVSVFLLIALTQIVRYYFHKTLTVPMNKILSQVQRIENEQYQVQEYEGLPLELESISHALNQASNVIEKRNNELLYYTNDLERLVKERTSELEEQMAKNVTTARLAAVGEMAADVAHEINNPLMVIDLHVTKLKRQEAEGVFKPETAHSIDKIQGMIKRIVKIIKGLKSLSRDGLSDPIAPFSISTMVEDVKMLVEMKVKAHDIEFSVQIPPQPLMALGREVQISQVLVNLISNAADAVITCEEKWITLDISEKEETIEFVITDSGKGIPEELREKIMRPFFTTKELNKGTGLGLSISKSIIEEHGGELKLNDDHQHTQFIFSLKKTVAGKLTA